MILAIAFILVGGLWSWSAIQNWRDRGGEKISLLEAAILKATGAEPLPLTRLDRALSWFHIVLATILGPILLCLGVAFGLRELGVLE